MKAILTFQGFTESAARRTGTEDLFFTVIRTFASREVTTYHPQPWTADVKSIADQLARQGIHRVALISYSHGQAAATAFARHAYGIGISCDLWLACDPVYRPTWLPRKTFLQVFALRALCPQGLIAVPPAITKVVSVRQELDLPRGHDLAATAPQRQRVMLPLILPYSHRDIDHANEWYALVRAELAAWLHPQTPKLK